MDTPGCGRLRAAPVSGCLRGYGWLPAAPSTAVPWSGSCPEPGEKERTGGDGQGRPATEEA